MRSNNGRLALVVAAVTCCAGGLGLAVGAQETQQVGTWAMAGATPQARTSAAAVALRDGRTLIAGGRDASDAVTDSILILDPVANTVVNAGQMLSPRVGHAAVVLADDRVVIIGGTAAGVVSADIEIFDPASGLSSLAALLLQPRTRHSAARLPDGKILIVGGATAEGVVMGNAEIFDPETGSVQPAAGSMQTPRRDASATTVVDGRVLVVGGNDGTQDLASAEMFDGVSGLFYALDPASYLTIPRSGHTALLLPHNNGVLVAGGLANGAAVTTVDLFLPAEFPDPYSYGVGHFVPAAPMLRERTRASGGPSGDNGHVFVMGGGRTDAEIYRFATIKTNKDDYAPGERAIITGAGWQPGENVRLVFQEDPAVHDDYVFSVLADGQGNIYWDQWAPEMHDLNVRFYLSASDSRSRAQITFTDGLPQQVVLNPASVTVTAGQSAQYTASVTMGGNNNACTVTMAVITTLPTGAAASFNNNPVSAANVDFSRTLTITTTASGASRTPPGSYPFTVRATRSANCNGSGLGPTTSGTLVVGGAAPTSLVASPATGTYGGTVSLSATLTTGGSGIDGQSISFTLNGTSVGSAMTNAGGVATLANVSLSGIGASTYPAGVVAEFAGDTSYAAASDSDALTVDKAAATINVTGFTGIYDGNAHGATGTATGVEGENLNSLLDLGASFTNVPGGTANWSFAGNSNYKTATGTAAIEITQADATINVAGYSGIYDGNAHGATGSATGVKGESLTSLLDFGATFTNVPGGTATWSFAGDTNYKSATGTVAIDIAQADATINVAGYSGIYDGDAHGATGTATGVQGESLTSLLDLGATFTNVPGGTATWSFAGDTNYKTATGTVAIDITQADAIINVIGHSGAYDGDPHGATGSATGVKGESLTSLLDFGATFTNVPGGTATWSFAGDTNYKTVTGTVAIDITQADAIINVNGYTGVYNGNPHGATGTATGVKGEPLSHLLGLGGTFTNVPGGTATWSFAGDTNYKTATGSVAIEIAKADAIINVYGYTGIYNGKAHSATGSATGVQGEPLSHLLDLGDSFTNVPGGTATWTFAGTSNYNTATGTVNIVINKAPQAISWATPAPIAYGTALGSSQLNAVVTTGDGALTYTPAAGAVLAVGTQTLQVTAAETANYLQTTKTVTLTVNPWHLTGFYNPVTMGGPSVLNSIKGGQTVPLKFNLYTAQGGTELTTVSSIDSFKVFPMGCSAATIEDPVELTTSGGTSLRYDGSQFIQNWQTPKGAGLCYQVTMKAKDGSTLSAFFKTK